MTKIREAAREFSQEAIRLGREAFGRADTDWWTRFMAIGQLATLVALIPLAVAFFCIDVVSDKVRGWGQKKYKIDLGEPSDRDKKRGRG